MMHKTISIDARMINYSGIGVYIEYLVRGLLAEGKYNVILIGDKNEIELKLSSVYLYRIIDIKIPIYSLKEQLYMPFVIPECDVFWSPHYNIPLFPIKATRRIVTIHDTYHLAYSQTFSMFKVLYAKILLKGAVTLSDKILTDSHFSKDEIIKFTGSTADKIEILYVGVDTNKFSKSIDEEVKKEVATRLALPKNFVLFVGNVKPNKNLVSLLEAFLLVIETSPDVKLVIVGKKDGFITGDERVYKLIEQNEQLRSRVHFTGYVLDSDLPIVYNLATLLAFPSIYEGFGLPPLEAMACECPVVVSSIASIPEVCGNAGQYVNPFAVESISEGIKLVLSNEQLRLELVQLGKDRVKEFTWSISLSKLMYVLDTI